ncbi:hypothetical protein BJ166DRAFT_504668 [Pestalotiopsis sp. NC0098]|nr:hypothetical protein BJ166DRAFT_504668 [Pestalotiopsis sp. NC0098]
MSCDEFEKGLEAGIVGNVEPWATKWSGEDNGGEQWDRSSQLSPSGQVSYTGFQQCRKGAVVELISWHLFWVGSVGKNGKVGGFRRTPLAIAQVRRKYMAFRVAFLYYSGVAIERWPPVDSKNYTDLYAKTVTSVKRLVDQPVEALRRVSTQEHQRALTQGRGSFSIRRRTSAIHNLSMEKETLPVIVSEICQRFDLERQGIEPMFLLPEYRCHDWLETTQFDLTQERPAATLVFRSLTVVVV